MKRASRVKKKTDNDINSTSLAVTTSELKPDLSKFKLTPKPKLSIISQSEPVIKRQHIQIIDHDAKPENWEAVLTNLREMRKKFNAPVDFMGCDKCHDESAAPEVMRYQALLALMLSSQTKDQVTFAAMKKLQEFGCNIENILGASDEKLGEMIYPVSFWKNKVKYIKKTSEILKSQYKGDIPNTVDELCKLPGVGPKMAHLCMKSAWGEVTGIGVDIHVHRICNRLGWVHSKTPEETRKQLEKWLPKEYWSEVSLLLVGFGQQVCQSSKPKCTTCSNKQFCPYFTKNKQK